MAFKILILKSETWINIVWIEIHNFFLEVWQEKKDLNERAEIANYKRKI